MHRSIGVMVIAFLSCIVMAVSGLAADNPTEGDLAGGWRLHADGSVFLSPKNAPKDIIWAIQLDGNHMRWTLVVIPQSGPPTFESYESDVGAAPVAVAGSPHKTSASVTLGTGNFTLKSTPSVGDLKAISTTCSLSGDKKQMDCPGTATKADGSSEKFDIKFDRM